jgi:hypothetical protein
VGQQIAEGSAYGILTIFATEGTPFASTMNSM